MGRRRAELRGQVYQLRADSGIKSQVHFQRLWATPEHRLGIPPWRLSLQGTTEASPPGFAVSVAGGPHWGLVNAAQKCHMGPGKGPASVCGLLMGWFARWTPAKNGAPQGTLCCPLEQWLGRTTPSSVERLSISLIIKCGCPLAQERFMEHFGSPLVTLHGKGPHLRGLSSFSWTQWISAGRKHIYLTFIKS